MFTIKAKATLTDPAELSHHRVHAQPSREHKYGVSVYFFAAVRYFCFSDRLSLCIPECPGVCSVDQAGLDLRAQHPAQSLFCGARKKVWVLCLKKQTVTQRLVTSWDNDSLSSLRYCWWNASGWSTNGDRRSNMALWCEPRAHLSLGNS